MKIQENGHPSLKWAWTLTGSGDKIFEGISGIRCFVWGLVRWVFRILRRLFIRILVVWALVARSRCSHVWIQFYVFRMSEITNQLTRYWHVFFFVAWEDYVRRRFHIFWSKIARKRFFFWNDLLDKAIFTWDSKLARIIAQDVIRWTTERALFWGLIKKLDYKPNLNRFGSELLAAWSCEVAKGDFLSLKWIFSAMGSRDSPTKLLEVTFSSVIWPVCLSTMIRHCLPSVCRNSP